MAISDQNTRLTKNKQFQVKSAKTMQLLVKKRELKAVFDLFTKVSKLDAGQKKQWLTENSELVADAFYSFLENAQDSFADISLADDTGLVTTEILDLLDKTTRLMDDLFEPRNKLES